MSDQMDCSFSFPLFFLSQILDYICHEAVEPVLESMALYFRGDNCCIYCLYSYLSPNPGMEIIRAQ